MRVSVIGAGTMGIGIAHFFAEKKQDVIFFDSSKLA
jgi:3-hydroxyacyl-CoA dehydrogenase